VVSVNKYLRGGKTSHTHTPLDGAGETEEEEEAEEANNTEVDWKEGEQYTKEINTIADEHEFRHNLSLEYWSASEWTCGTGGLEDLERDGRVNCGLCCCGPEFEGPSLEDKVAEAE